MIKTLTNIVCWLLALLVVASAISINAQRASTKIREKTIEEAELIDIDPTSGVYHISFDGEIHEFSFSK